MRLTEHFDSSEFRCKHCGAYAIQLDLVHALEKLRAAIGRPIIVTSGYRCPKHPVEARKKKPGKHALGIAADITVPGMTARELYRAAAAVPEFKGLGVDDTRNYVHVDIRAEPAKWCYDTSGVTVPWFEV